jgi:hypothetical protein
MAHAYVALYVRLMRLRAPVRMGAPACLVS